MSAVNGIVGPLKKIDGYNTLINAVASRNTPVLASGIIESQKCHLVYGVMKHTSRPAFIITNSELKAKLIHEDLGFFTHNTALLYPAKDVIFYSADVRSAEITKKRSEVLNALVSGECSVVVASVEALFDRLMKRGTFEKGIARYAPGQSVKMEEMLKSLIDAGYERVELVEGAGQFSRRGGIIDIYPISAEMPARIEFWGDEIESVRTFDLQSQRSIEKIDCIRIVPARELQEGADARETVTLLDYLPDDTVVFFDEPHRIKQHAESVIAEFNESMESREEKTKLSALFNYYDILRAAERFPQCLLLNVYARADDFAVRASVAFTTRQSVAFTNRMDMLAEDLKRYKQNDYRTLVLGGPRTRAERLARELSEMGAEAFFIENPFDTEIPAGAVAVAKGSLHHGFEYPEAKFAVISDREIFGERKRRKAFKKKGSPLESFTDLKTGDYVVHLTHGIGVYRGIKRAEIKTEENGFTKDFIEIEFADGGTLGVSVTQLDMLQKYIGSEGYKPKLNKLGGQEWERTKARARAAAKELAGELAALYAKRQASVGHKFTPDTLWQKEFEETFPFEETDDQLNAISDVKRDMESARVMDRLVCGDVGYGKTEIALRAAFKCAQDGRQTAYLVPTTILAQQHYNTFTERMGDYPVSVEMLSRFKTPAQQKKIIDDLRSGKVDIIIATHRIISKDIEFRDLGLVIIDEEQRFGVKHKEKLKKLKENVDVLTLTATPIPRTLHMSIAGMRDLSLLEEPPLERRPIQTYVMEYDGQLVRDAVHRELARGGQVYYLHNRVHNIVETGIKLQKLIPEARIACAHGQMGERELESIMVDFINGDIDVLVCTTIVEAGLDIPNVNTIIIQDADYMGLAQLYQLRGRVGRSNRLAYAYLCYRRDKTLTEAAEKRLQTIKEFTEFGSGFKIAMRDLEIRGAGSLLGGEQHGHMEAVGYDMYLKLLNEAVKEEKNEETVEDFETFIDINADAFIPKTYIDSELQRLAAYKRIAQIAGDGDYDDVRDEIEDRYGSIPAQINNLLEISLLKSYAHEMGVISVVQKGGSLVITFKSDAKMEPTAITEFIRRGGRNVFFTAAPNPYITVKNIGNGGPVYIKNLLHELKGLNCDV